MVAPGRYTVALAKRVDGVVTAIGDPQSFMVAPLDSGTTPRSAGGRRIPAEDGRAATRIARRERGSE